MSYSFIIGTRHAHRNREGYCTRGLAKNAVFLQVYVRSRVLALAGSASVSRRLGLGSEVIRQAFADTLTEGISLSSVKEEAGSSGPPLQLSFGHECQ